MSEYIAWDDCVAKYGVWDIFPTEWNGFPIHHTDPFWNAALFDEPQHRQFRVDGPDFEVRGDWTADDVSLQASKLVKGMLLEIKDDSGYLSIWLDQETCEAFQAFINTTK